jgi:hypothetical protein
LPSQEFLTSTAETDSEKPKGRLSESWHFETMELRVHGLDARSGVMTSGPFAILRVAAIGDGYADVMMGFVS